MENKIADWLSRNPIKVGKLAENDENEGDSERSEDKIIIKINAFRAKPIKGTNSEDESKLAGESETEREQTNTRIYWC